MNTTFDRLKTLLQGFLYKNKDTQCMIQEIASKYTNMKADTDNINIQAQLTARLTYANKGTHNYGYKPDNT